MYLLNQTFATMHYKFLSWNIHVGFANVKPGYSCLNTLRKISRNLVCINGGLAREF